MSERQAEYNALIEPHCAPHNKKQMSVTDDEARLILRYRQAAGQGRLLVVDPDAKCWYLCGPQERSR